MRLAKGVHIEWVDDEAVVLDQASGHLHYLNASAALILAMVLEHGLDKGVTELTALVGEASSLNEDVETVLADLREKNLFVDAGAEIDTAG